MTFYTINYNLNNIYRYFLFNISYFLLKPLLNLQYLILHNSRLFHLFEQKGLIIGTLQAMHHLYKCLFPQFQIGSLVDTSLTMHKHHRKENKHLLYRSEERRVGKEYRAQIT